MRLFCFLIFTPFRTTKALGLPGAHLTDVTDRIQLG